SVDSLRGAAALVRRLERRLGCRVTQARVAPLRAVDTTTLAIAATPPATGRLRLITAGVATPGGTGAWAGVPLWLDRPLRAARGCAGRGHGPGRVRLGARGRAAAGPAGRRGAGRRGAGGRRRGRADLQSAERNASGDRSGRPGRRRRL